MSLISLISLEPEPRSAKVVCLSTPDWRWGGWMRRLGSRGDGGGGGVRWTSRLLGLELGSASADLEVGEERWACVLE